MEIEPCLAPGAVGGILVEREAVVEPWLVSIGYAQAAKRAGATIVTGQHVVGAKGGSHGWTLTTKQGDEFKCDVVVNCAGLYADDVERLRDAEHRDFEIKPRRGQFVVLQPGPGLHLNHIIAPVPNRVTKGVQSFQSVWGNIIVGPTAVEQVSRDDRTCDAATRSALLKLATQRLGPEHAGRWAVAGEYVGIRPATEHQDYQIKKREGQNWITVGGIRSSGLSGASGIAEYVGNVLLDGQDGPAPHCSGISDAVVNQVPAVSNVKMAPAIPDLHTLAAQFQERGDGTLEIDGTRWLVTHPITQIGLRSMRLSPGA